MRACCRHVRACVRSQLNLGLCAMRAGKPVHGSRSWQRHRHLTDVKLCYTASPDVVQLPVYFHLGRLVTPSEEDASHTA
jgi:hypothetical protein